MQHLIDLKKVFEVADIEIKYVRGENTLKE
jgi:hypothetical protein